MTAYFRELRRRFWEIVWRWIVGPERIEIEDPEDAEEKCE